MRKIAFLGLLMVLILVPLVSCSSNDSNGGAAASQNQGSALATLPGASPYPSGTLSNDSNGGAAASQNQGSALAALPVASPSPSVTPSIFPGEAEVVDTGVVGGATPSTYEVFIKMDGITGESTKGGHEGWIELESYNYEVTGPVPIDSLHMGEVGFGDLVIMKQLDKSSPKLYEACCNGKHFPEVILEVCESGGTRNVFMRYVLKDVICKHIDSSSPKIFKEWGSASPQIFSIAPSGDMVEPESRPIESISLNFSKIQWEYITSDGQTVTAGWDTVENKGL